MKKLLLAIALLLPASSFASTKVLGTFTASGQTFLVSPPNTHLSFETDFTAGTGTIDFTCRLNAAAPFGAFQTAVTSCTNSPNPCIRQGLPYCQTYQITATACSSCTAVVYATDDDSSLIAQIVQITTTTTSTSTSSSTSSSSTSSTSTTSTSSTSSSVTTTSTSSTTSTT